VGLVLCCLRPRVRQSSACLTRALGRWTWKERAVDARERNTQTRSTPTRHTRQTPSLALSLKKPNPKKTQQARYTLTLPYVTALQTGGLHMPVRVVYDAGTEQQEPGGRASEGAGAGAGAGADGDGGGDGRAAWRYRSERLRLELYDGQDVTVTAQGVVYSAYPRVNATACDQMAEPAGPTAAGGGRRGNGLPSLAPLPVVSRPDWQYAGRALVPAVSPRALKAGGGAELKPQRMREAVVWSNSTRHPGGAKTSSYRFYVDARTGAPLRLYMVGYNIMAASHYDEYLLDFEAFEARDFDADGGKDGGDSGSDGDGGSDGGGGEGGDEFAIPDACPRARAPAEHNSRTFAGVAAQAAAAMPWSVPRAEAALGERGAAAAAAAAASSLSPRLLPLASGGGSGDAASDMSDAPLSTRRALARRHALAYVEEWNGRREEELRSLRRQGGELAPTNGGGGGNGSDVWLALSSSLARPLLRMNHLASLTQEEYAATMASGAGGLAERRRRAARAAALGGLADEDTLARADALALPAHLRRYHLGTLVPSYETTDGSVAGNRRKQKRRPPPREVDWRGTAADPGAPSDQGTCGSCWAFAAAGAMGGAWAVATGQARALSQQQMVDCAWRTGNNGCGGGWAERAIAYVADSSVSGGAVSDEFYPYTNADAWCGDAGAWPLNRGRTPARGGSWAAGEGLTAVQADADADGPPRGVARFRGVAAVRPHDDAALMDAVARHGPVAVSIDASPLSFKFYGEGVYWSPECGWRPRDLDHAVLLVGYGTSPEGADYWLIKNSWGAMWGSDGFVRVKRGFGVDCGITTRPFLAVVDEGAAADAAAASGGAPLVEGWAAPRVVGAEATAGGAREAA